LSPVEIKIAGGLVCDGEGGEPAPADVGIRGGRICAVGVVREEASFTLDAAGMIVCPGFIDAHTHSDVFLLVEPGAPSKLRQGVTTEVLGNCGASAAPLLPGYMLPSDWRDKPVGAKWSSVAEFRTVLQQACPSVNAVLLAGHGNLRGGTVGYESRAARPDELALMIRRLEQALDEGARGMSTGLIYPPGMFAASGEIEALAGVLARRGGIYTTHMASEGDRLAECVDDNLRLARKTGVSVQISHLKTSGRRNWQKTGAVLDAIRAARASGADVTADRYPYTYGCTDFDIIFPPWFQEGGRNAALARLEDPAVSARLRSELAAALSLTDAGGIVIASVFAPAMKRFRGRTLADAAAELETDPADAAVRIARADELRTTAFFHGMSEEDMFATLAEPYVMIGSDASLRAPEGPLSADYPHPRAYGTFPRFLRFSLDGRTVPPGEAVRKMTSLPASRFGLSDRGVLKPGKAADITVFDPAEVRDLATPSAPHLFPAGIRHVIVNGQLAIENGIPTGKRAGRVL